MAPLIVLKVYFISGGVLQCFYLQILKLNKEGKILCNAMSIFLSWNIMKNDINSLFSTNTSLLYNTEFNSYNRPVEHQAISAWSAIFSTYEQNSI